MSERLLNLSSRIRNEMFDLERLVHRAQDAWHQAQQSGDDLYLDSAALNLHGFYAGLERLFELIAGMIDGAVPQGANWHQVLLKQMANENPSVRPAVISEQCLEALDEYRGFRHIVRHVYTFNFDPVKAQRLIEKSSAVYAAVREELLAFANFLEQHASQKDF